MDHVLHLIELYEDNSVLWNHTMEEHKDLSAFEQAKQKIVERLKKKGWHYIVKHVGKKINSLKSNFRRTHKKSRIVKLLEFQVINCTSLERIFLGQRKTSLSQHAFDLKCMDSYASDARTKIKCKMSSDFVHEIFSVCAP